MAELLREYANRGSPDDRASVGHPSVPAAESEPGRGPCPGSLPAAGALRSTLDTHETNTPTFSSGIVHITSEPCYAPGMRSPVAALKDRFLKYAGELRFPKLLLLTLVLFSVDLVVPDFIPFIDEILLGLVAALLATLKKKRRAQIEVSTAPPPQALPPQ